MNDYFKLSKQDGVLLIGLDQPDSRVNTLSQAALKSFEEDLDSIENAAELNAEVSVS